MSASVAPSPAAGPATRPAGGRADAVALAVLGLAVLAYFLPFVARRQVFYQVDLAFMDHPLRAHAFDHLRHGEFPLWCPHLLTGFPLFAEGQAALLYPPSWLYLALSRETALNAYVVLHYLLLAGSAYVFLRSNLSATAAALGAATLVFSSFALVMHVLPGFLAVIAWTPALLWSGEQFLGGGGRRWLALSASIVALMHFAGDPLGTWLAGLLFAAWVAVGVPVATARRRALALAVSLGLGTLLAAAQLAPTLEFLGESNRGAGRSPGPPREHFVPAANALTALLPRFHGTRFSDYSGPQPPVWEESLLFFTGFSTLLLVPFGLGRDRRGLFWCGAALAALLVSSREAHALVGPLWQWPPFVLFRWPGHALLWFALAVAALAGRGLDALVVAPSRAAASPWRRGVALALVAAGFVLAWGSAAPDAGLLSARRGDALALVTSASVAALGWRARPWIGGTALGWVFVTILAAGVRLAPGPEGLPADAYARAEGAIAVLAPMLGADGRLLALRAWDRPARPQDAETFARVAATAPANLHLLAGLTAVGQFDLAHTATLWRSRTALAAPGPRVLDLLGVELVVGADTAEEAASALSVAGPAYAPCRVGHPLVLCRSAPAPRAFLARKQVVTSAAAALEAIARAEGPDPREVVVLEQAPQWPAMASAAAAEDRVTIVDRSATRVGLEVAAREPALLVLAEGHAAGWRARLDGEAVPVLAAHGFVRAVAVPAGRYRLEFRYEPSSLAIGLGISIAAAGAWLWLALSRGSTS